MKKSSFLLLLVCFLISAGCSQNTGSKESKNAAPASAAKQEEKPKSDFPKKTIEMIIPYEVGGTNDVISRVLVSAVNKYIPNGQSVVIENKPGAGVRLA